MNKKKKSWVILVAVSIVILWTIVSPKMIVLAEEGIGFSYHNKIPKNQITKGSYFDLLVKPKDQQVLVTEIRNESRETIEIKISINDSKTNQNGQIEYGPSTLKNTKTLPYKLNDILTGPSEVTLKKGEVKEVEFVLKVPEKAFEGVLLGGIQLEKMTKDEPSDKEISVKNKYAYNFSISIRENKKILPYEIETQGTSFLNVNDQKWINLAISNNSQEIVKEMKVETIITEENSNEVLLENVAENLKMAPMSIMEYLIPFPEGAPGKYIEKTKVTTGKDVISWENTFTISEKLNQLGNEKLIERNQNGFNILWVIGILATLLIGTLILFIVIKLYKK